MDIDEIFESIRKTIEDGKSPDRPFIVGVNGIERSGKSFFTTKLSSFLKQKNYTVQVLHLDDFLYPREIRYAGNLAESYYERSFDLETLVQKILNPLHEKGAYEVELTLLDYDTDKLTNNKRYEFSKDTVLLLEGVFLFRNELSPYIDYKVFLDVSFDESEKRARQRDVPKYGEKILQTSYERYFPAEKKYLEQFHPMKIADLVIDYNDWHNPKLIDTNS